MLTAPHVVGDEAHLAQSEIRRVPESRLVREPAGLDAVIVTVHLPRQQVGLLPHQAGRDHVFRAHAPAGVPSVVPAPAVGSEPTVSAGAE
jgi:hypothetical protein